MHLRLDAPVLALEAGQLFALDDARGTRIQPREGTLWITEEGEPKDFVGRVRAGAVDDYHLVRAVCVPLDAHERLEQVIGAVARGQHDGEFETGNSGLNGHS